MHATDNYGQLHFTPPHYSADIHSNVSGKGIHNAMIIKLLRKPTSVLGLATGSTPVGLYRELARRHKEEGLVPVVVHLEEPLH